jgi:hypothetical protein
MVDIQALWSLMQKKFPDYLRSPQALSKIVRLVDPRSITAKQIGEEIQIQAKVWIKPPRKAPNTTTLKLSVSGLTMTSKVDVDPRLFSSPNPDDAMTETIRSLYMCSLLTLGIFNVPVKREAFLVMTKLKAQGA